MNKYAKNSLIGIGLIFVLLITFYLGKDYANYKSYVHYHANFGMFINGEKVDFSDDKYMEDIAACKFGVLKSQKDRVHLHENNGGTIHVHHDGVTWGHFSANVGYEFGDNFISTDNSGILLSDNNNKITFILNGKEVQNPFNREIKSEDTLLINYGNENFEYISKNYYPEITKDAEKYNEMKDPTTCSGDNFSFFKEVTDLFHHEH